MAFLNVSFSYQKQFSELLLKAASDYEALSKSVDDFRWSHDFRESPAVWGVSWKFLF
jgi:HAUS augmin-like complex subunit 2